MCFEYVEIFMPQDLLRPDGNGVSPASQHIVYVLLCGLSNGGVVVVGPSISFPL